MGASRLLLALMATALVAAPLLAAPLLAAPPAPKGPAKAAEKQPHRAHGAHEHGSGKLNIGLEGTKGEVEWEMPADSVVGFEHEPKTPGDKQKVAAALAKIKANFGRMVVMPAAAGCTYMAKELELERDGTHSEVHAHFDVTCRQVPAGEIRFAFGSFFPAVHQLEVQLVTNKGQAGATIQDEKGTLRIP